ncbi:MAG TPA: DUF6084 family protein [Bryobacteraceae bacterium]|jgi:hypothetical protein
MPDLSITVDSADPVPFAAAPLLAFKLRVTNKDPNEQIHTVVLRCQIQIEVTRRRYTPQDQEHLKDLFGEPSRWGQTLRNLLWVNASTVVPQFTGTTTVDLPVPCTFDFSVATTKYFDGLADGDIPIVMMFSGTVFYNDADGALQAAPIGWDKETKFRLPLQRWKDMMETFYPNQAWLCLRKDVFEDLHRFKVERGIPTWEEVVKILLASGASEAVGA